MKKGIHPTYYPDAQVICACGNTWTTGSTRKVIRTEVCSSCHPFFTGQQQRLVDIEGQVDRFYRKLEASKTMKNSVKAREEGRVSSARPVTDLDLGTKPTEALARAGITTIGQILEKLQNGTAEILAVEGFGRKSLIDLKKKLRAQGFAIPEAAEDLSA
ncbi:MAG: 50S ribosomal protein L31 [Longilinea sp.]|jgi:large subunit ribosomal protein L31|nr:50S ribosomal protein L31 [Longilinea sp.]NMD31654.1 50S ribosomal protein L31 [Chloroflexota bacterium]